MPDLAPRRSVPAMGRAAVVRSGHYAPVRDAVAARLRLGPMPFNAAVGAARAVMPHSRPSLTARNVAIVRGRFGRPCIPTGDPAAEDQLVGSLPLTLPLQLPGMTRYLRERTKFFDCALLDAYARGTRQVVIVGAGYDGRSLRYRHPGVTFFEVDHPATQADKRDRLGWVRADAKDVRFVSVAFGQDLVSEQLAIAGHDTETATHFMSEGVTSYVPRRELATLVDGVAGRAGPGSSFAIDFVTSGTDKPFIRRLMLRAVRAGTAMLGEKIVTVLDPAAVEELLRSAGWSEVQLQPPAGPFPAVFAVAVGGRRSNRS